MPKLVFDIETIGEDFDKLDEKSQHYILQNAQRYGKTEEEVEEKKSSLGFSPLTGQVVAIGLYNPDTKKGRVLFQSPDKDSSGEETENADYVKMTEKQMLTEFWEVVRKYDEFITFNGRGFDVPFLNIRSAICGLRPSKDLLSNRFLSSQKFAALHVDLLDQLTFYGATPRQKLHFFCRAFGIKSPKEGEITGEEIGQAFKDKRYLEIAQYCFFDLVATAELYEYWDKYLRF